MAIKNVVFAIPGGWYNSCVLGVTGDWVVYVVYRQANCLSDVGDEELVLTNSMPVAKLHPNYPNPFNPATTIRFDLSLAPPVELAVFSADGKRVRTLVQRHMPAGSHEVVWRGRDDRGRSLPSGIYICRLQTGSDSEMRRMILIK